MIGPVARGSMTVAPSVIARQERVESGEQVIVRSGSKLHDDDAGGGVRHEDVEQPVTAAGRLRNEGSAGIGQVEGAAAGAGAHLDLARIHARERISRAVRSTTRSAPIIRLMTRRDRGRPIVVALLLGVLLGACGSAEPTPSPIPSAPGSPGPTTKPTPSPTPSPLATPTPVPFDQSLLDRRVTVLVLGTDNNDIRRARGYVENTDALMVVSIDAAHTQISMMSLPRDTVDVPMADGGTWTDKINSLRRVRGYEATVGTFETLFGVAIDYYVEIDMADFGRLVNAVGGIDVENAYPLYDPAIGLDLPAGPAHLNGNNAARYVRTRVDMDYARAGRAQEVLTALVRKFVDPTTTLDPIRFLAGLKSLQTDIPPDKIATLIELARRARDATVVGEVMGPPRFALFQGFAGTRGWVMIPNVPELRAYARSVMGD